MYSVSTHGQLLLISTVRMYIRMYIPGLVSTPG